MMQAYREKQKAINTVKRRGQDRLMHLSNALTASSCPQLQTAAQIIQDTWASITSDDGLLAENVLIPESPELLLSVLADVVRDNPDLIEHVVDAFEEYEALRTPLLFDGDDPMTRDQLTQTLGGMLTSGDLGELHEIPQAIELILGTICAHRVIVLKPHEFQVGPDGQPVSLVPGYRIVPEEHAHYALPPRMMYMRITARCEVIDWAQGAREEIEPPNMRIPLYPYIPLKFPDMTVKANLLYV